MEVIVTVFLLTLIMTSLFFALTRSEFSNSIVSAKADLQVKVRTVIDWIVKDTRQSNLIQINTNSPTQDHIKFKQVTGINNVTGEYTFSSTYIEYDYDSGTDVLTRNEIDADGTTVLRSWDFDNIMESPFYSDVATPLAANAILSSKKLVIVIAGQCQVRGTTLDLSVTEEVKIRNE